MGGSGGGFGGFGGGGGADSDDDRAIDPSKPLLLSAVDEDTKASGFYRDQLGVTTRAGDGSSWPMRRMRQREQGANAELYLVTRGTFVDFPNLYAGTSLASLNQISDANPQQKDYNWGTVELVRWIEHRRRAAPGAALQARELRLHEEVPDDHLLLRAALAEPAQLRRAERAQRHQPDALRLATATSSSSRTSTTRMGYPGPSAMKSIVPGVQTLLARGYVDPKALGVYRASRGAATRRST